MGRSPGFGSYACNLTRFSHSVSLRLRTSKFLTFAAYSNSPDRSTKSTTSHLDVLCVLVNTRFQVLFHSPPGVLFTFPSQYFFSIAHQVVFRLRGWSPCLHTEFLVFRTTLDPAARSFISRTRLSLSSVCLPIHFCYELTWLMLSETPGIFLLPV